MPPLPNKTARYRALPCIGRVETDRMFYEQLNNTTNVWSRPSGTTSSVVKFSMNGTQITESEGHPWNTRKRGSNKDIGGDFFTQKKYVLGKVPTYRLNAVWLSGATTRRRLNWLTPGIGAPDSLFTTKNQAPSPDFIDLKTLPVTAFPPPSISSDDDLDEYGATAISLCKPTNSVADLSVAIGELAKEGLPNIAGHALWKNRLASERSMRRNAKDVAQEHLNYSFGIKPILSEIKDFKNGILKIDDIIRQFEDDAGKDVRRRFYFPKDRKVEETVMPASPPACRPNGFDPFDDWGTVVRRRETVTRRWFSGCFTYTLPLGMNSRTKLGEIRLKADRLGLDPDLETAYNVAPWSWAVDWFSNLGDVVSNYNDFQKYGLIMRYGYIMEHVRVSDTYIRTGCLLRGGQPVRFPSLTLVTETKRRRKANPFGFGVKWEGLSPFQLSIAAALGISRGSIAK